MQIPLSAAPDDLIRFDLEPHIGLDIRLTRKQVVVSAVRPYRRNELRGQQPPTGFDGSFDGRRQLRVGEVHDDGAGAGKSVER
ncbi:hypothetical protein [Paraburkholderia fynbosensis]|uniref:hypothetical protein n=1 Tax=Paraburkholderia fynbosensis TaxID=1200993 RepID=UPI0015825D9A|nr:hypothetical protein [Paraburkholderia fynbosensis]